MWPVFIIQSEFVYSGLESFWSFVTHKLSGVCSARLGDFVLALSVLLLLHPFCYHFTGVEL